MAQLNVKLSADRVEALRRYAHRHQTPLAWLIRDYVDYLLAGGKPVAPPPTGTDTVLVSAAPLTAGAGAGVET